MATSSAGLLVVTLSASLSVATVDALLTATEDALCAHGATRIWVDATLPGIAVMAEFGPSAPAS